MTYRELLESNEWKSRRLGIILRDGMKCIHCSNANLLNIGKAGFYESVFEKPFDHIFLNHFGETKGRLVGFPKELKHRLPAQGYAVSFYDEISDRHYLLAARKLLAEETEYYVFGKQKKLAAYFNSKWKEKRVTGVELFKFLIAKGNLESDDAEVNAILQESIPEIEIDPSKISWDYVAGLQVHHKYYQIGKLPWEYPDDALETLCSHCHQQLHQNETISVYNEKMELIKQFKICSRCLGTGYFPEFKHVDAGICYRCNGARYEELIK